VAQRHVDKAHILGARQICGKVMVQLRAVAGQNSYARNLRYNVFGQLTRVEYGTSPMLVQTHAYWGPDVERGQGRLRWTQAGITGTAYTDLQNLTYGQGANPGYDAVGNITQIRDANAGGIQTQTFSYDELDRLKTAQASGGSGGTYSQQSYLYDELGNLTSKGGALYNYGPQSSSCPHGPLNQPHTAVSALTYSYCYDYNGNMVRRTPHAGGATRDLVYDAENRLTHVASNLNNSVTILARFVYDGDGNRVKKIEGGITTVYVGDYYELDAQTSSSDPCECPPGMNCLDVQCPLSSGGATISASYPVIRLYYYAGSQRIAMRQGTTLRFLLGDHLGSTALTVSSTGTKVGELRYHPWGETRFSDGSTPTQRRFTGQILDSATDLYYYGARYYDPGLGRFIQADTIVPEPGNPQALNRYSYVYNNPLKYTDPSGHSPCRDGDRACWTAEYNARAEWYRYHGYEQRSGNWVYTGNFKTGWIEDADIRRRVIRQYAEVLKHNNTPVGEALARITHITASFYSTPRGIVQAGTFVDDIAHVITGMAGPDVLMDLARGEGGKGPYFIGREAFPDTDLRSIFRDNSAGQAYHFWFYVTVSFWNGPNVARAGNMLHESALAPLNAGGRSPQDLALGEAGVLLGEGLRNRWIPIYKTSSFIRSVLMR
jgi:RHS repeat-associated protein